MKPGVRARYNTKFKARKKHADAGLYRKKGQMKVAYAVMWEGKDDDNGGLIYGIEYMNGEEVSDVEWFKTSDERDAELKQYISDLKESIE